MTDYVTKPHTFDEMQTTSMATAGDITTHFGSSFDGNRFTLDFVGTGSPAGYFVVILGHGASGPTIVYTNTDGYLRAERDGNGNTVDYTYSSTALGSDPEFETA